MEGAPQPQRKPAASCSRWPAAALFHRPPHSPSSPACSTGAGKFKPSYLPDAADKVEGEGIEKFETAAHDTAVAQQAVTYGLHLRSRPGEQAAANGGGEHREQQEQQPAAVPADRDAAKLK